MRGWSVVVLVLAAGPQIVRAQTPSPPAPEQVRRIERFLGRTAARGAGARVGIDVWLVPNGRTIEGLPLPLTGLTIVEVRGGSVTRVLEGGRKRFRAGEFWTVPPGGRVSFETEDDSAALQTTVLGE